MVSTALPYSFTTLRFIGRCLRPLLLFMVAYLNASTIFNPMLSFIVRVLYVFMLGVVRVAFSALPNVYLGCFLGLTSLL